MKICETYLQKNGEEKLFKSTYSKKYSEIKNLNTGEFWDEHFVDQTNFDNQDEMTKEKIDAVISCLPKQNSKILDLGIGQAYLEERLFRKKLNYKLYGIDISKNSIKKVSSKFKGDFKQANVFNIEKLYKKNSFDAIVALELIEHIPPQKIFRLYEMIHYLLKPGGVLIITTPTNEGLSNKKTCLPAGMVNPSGHVRDYTVPILEMEFGASGFKIVKRKTFFAFPNKYKLKQTLARILRNRWRPNNILIAARKA